MFKISQHTTNIVLITITLLLVLILATGLANASYLGSYTSSNKLLLHMNGTNGGTTFTDSATAKTITNTGSVVTNTSVLQFGTASGQFSGSNSLSLSDNADWYWGSSNFTIMCWVNKSVATSTKVLSSQVSGSGSYKGHQLQISNTTITFTGYNTNGGTSATKSATMNDNAWHQIVVRGVSGTITVYVDGSGGTPVAMGVGDSTGTYYVGVDWDGSSSKYNGYMDEYSVWKGVAIPIAELYPQTVEVGAISNTPIVSFTVSPINTTMCTNTTYTFTDTSSDSPSSWLWDFGDGTNSTSQNPTHVFTSAGNYTVTLNATNTFGSNNTTANYTFSNNPYLYPYLSSNVLHLAMDGLEGGTTFTESAKSKAVTVSGTTHTTQVYKQFGSASASFDGASSTHLSLASSSDFDLASGDFTILCWERRAKTSDGTRYLLSRLSSGPYNGLQLYTTGANVFFTGYSGGSSASAVKTMTDDTNWHQIIVRGVAGTITVYVDGVGGTPVAVPMGTSSGTMYVGCDWDGSSTPMNGTLDEIAIWKGAAIPIADLYPQPYAINTSPVPPVASFTVGGISNNTLLSNMSYTFTDTSTGEDSRLWDFGDGTNSTLSSQSHSYALAGIYTVTLNSTNAFGSSNVSQNYTVNPSNLLPNWHSLGSKFSNREGSGAAVINNIMFVFGGRSSTSGTYYHDVYKSTDGNTWTQINDAPWSGRAFMGYTTAGNTIWFVGGYDGSSNVADVYKATYNSTTGNLTWTQTTSNTGAGARHAAALLDYNGYLYLLSGWSGVNSVYKSADTDGASWALVTSSPPFATQTWGSAVVFNGKMWVMNGKSSESYPSGFPSTVYYSTDGVTWTLATTGSWAGRYCSPVVVDSTHNIMYMLGGGYWINTGPSAYYNDTWYTTDGTNWAEMSANSAFTARGYDPGIYFNGNMYLIGGDIASGIVGDVWTTAQMTPILTWSNPINITYGTALNATQLNADSGGIAGSFVYTPTSGTVLGVGNAQNLNVVFTPIDLGNYSSITQNVSINVSQASTSIVWANPSNITYGTALSGTQLNATGSVAGTVTYNVSVGNILSAGTHTLHADFAPTDTTNYTSNSKNVTLNVTQVTPTISWIQPSAINYGVALNSSQLSATTSTPGTFVYNPVSGTVLSAGTQTLSTTFTPTDGANYTTNTASVSLTVNKIAPVITWNTPASIPYGTALSSTQLSATCPQTGLFVYNPASGTVLSGGSHTLNTTFTPSGADATNYTTNTTSVTLVVDHFTPTITWSNPANITYGTALSGTQLNADSGGIAGTFTYTPASGTVLGVGTGQTLHVDYTPTDSANYTGSSKDVSINVSKATSIVTWSTPSPITYGTALSGTQLNAACATTAGTFVYSPVSGTVLSAGSQTLSVIFTPTDSTNYTINSTVNVTLTVNKAPTTIAWNNPANITYGTSLNGTQLNASPSVGGTLTYSPISGTVMHAGDGQNLHVDLTPTDSTNYSTSSKDVSINVTKITSVITWSNPADIINPAALSSAQLNAACATTAGSFAYSPASGVVLSPGNGQTLSTTFTPTDATNYTTVTASATINVKNAIPSASFTENLTSGTVPLTVQFNDTSTGANISAWLWQWGDGTANSTVRNAIHTFTSAGTYIVNLTVTNDGGSSESSNTNISPGKTTPTITWSNPSAITYGIALSATQLNASAGVAGTYTYTPANGTVLEAGSQNLHVDFNPTDTTNYTSASKDVSITVNKVSTGVTWTTPSPITYGTALSATQLNATNNISLAGSYAYSPVNGAVLSAGTQTLNVTFTPTDASNYTGCSGSVNLIVNKAIPVITWHDPDEIVHGTPLSSTQLAASASVSGNFVYDPTTGTILAVGGHTLNTTFTPDDLVNYTAVSASVHINVVTGSSSNPPVTSFTVNVTSGEVPLVVHFIDNTTGQTSEVLDFGDNTSTSNTANVVHTYSNVGTYHATLTASNAHGESSATITINVTNATSAPDEPQTFHITRKAPTSSDNLVTAKSNAASILVDVDSNLYDKVNSAIGGGYSLAAIIIVLLGAIGIMRYLGMI